MTSLCPRWCGKDDCRGPCPPLVGAVRAHDHPSFVAALNERRPQHLRRDDPPLVLAAAIANHMLQRGIDERTAALARRRWWQRYRARHGAK